MRHRLVLVLGDFVGSEASLGEVLTEWTSAGILDSVGWMSIKPASSSGHTVNVGIKNSVVSQELFELLTSRIWSHVTVLAVRQSSLGSLAESRFEDELRLMTMVEESFSVHKDLKFRSATISVAETEGLVESGFNPRWDLHLLQEPVIRIDTAVASQPMGEEHRPLLLALLAMTASGGFTWQFGPLLDDLKDPTIGNEKPIRVGRAFVRVVSAGRLTDEVLTGAFPASGPWSVPPDVTNGRAVPPGTTVPDNVVSAVNVAGRFEYKRWKTPPKKNPNVGIGILDGLKLFFREFWAAIKGIPLSFVSMVKREVEEFVQRATFGNNSTVLLKFDPTESILDPDEAIDAIRNLNLGGEVDPVGDSQAWVTLQQTALSCVDGGRMPGEVPPPMSGTNRLVYTDPLAIGPAPDDVPFKVSDFERALLNLQDTAESIEPMDIENGYTLHLRLAALRRELDEAQKSGTSQSQSLGSEKSVDVPVKAQSDSVEDKKSKKKSKKKKKVKASKAASSKFSILKKIRFGKTTSKVDAEKTLPPPNAKSEVSDQLPVDQESTEAVSTDTATEATSTEVPKTKDLNRHSPKSKDFRSSEYVLIGSFYQGSREELLSEYAEENERYQAASKEYSAVSAYWSLNKTCDHCGTAFDHGLVYLHEPTSQLVHVGHVCARKSFPIQNEQDFISRKLADLEGRWNSWLSIRQGSLLWRVGISILQGTIAARSDLSHALQALEAAPKANELENAARKKFTRWTRRGMLSFLIVAALSVASIIFTPLPLLIFVLILVSHFSGLLIRLILLARDVVRAQYRMMTEMDEYEQNYNLARQAVNEVVRLASVQDQFDDWQEIIREVVHVPFGKGNALTESGKGMDEVRRPPALVLGKSNPDTQQKMQLFLNARRQTIHAGWLTEIMDVLKEEWKTEYSNVRLTGPGDNIVPEADNAPSGSVVGKKPLSDENVYYPRTDFRFGVESGTLQQKLVLRKAEQIAEDLRKTPIDQLLGQVEVTGLGSALSGLPVQDFLAGLSVPPPEPVSFPPDLISDSFPQYRVFGPEVTLPPYGSAEAGTGQIKVESGVELTAATWRVELSDHLHPHIVLRGFGRTASDALHVFHENSEDEGVIP